MVRQSSGTRPAPGAGPGRSRPGQPGRTPPRGAGRRRRRGRAGFTLIEALVAVVLVAVGVVGVFGGIRSLTVARVRAETADLLQRLAVQKANELVATTTDPSTASAGGDFSDQGYQDVSWSADVEQEDATDIESVKVTVTRGNDEQTVSVLQFVRPQTGSGGAGGAAGGANGGATGGANGGANGGASGSGAGGGAAGGGQ